VCGWNWGQTEIAGNALRFQVLPGGPESDTWFPAFEIPMTAVQKAYPQGTNKREVILDFQRDPDDAVYERAPQMESMRFHFTSKGNEEDDSMKTNSELLIHDIMEHVQEDVIAEEAIIKFEGAYRFMCLNLSRAKYSFHFYATVLRVRSDTYDHKIKYSDVKRLFLLALPKGGYNLVMQLDPPLRRQNHKVSMIVIQFGEGDALPEDAELNTEGEGVADMLKDISLKEEDDPETNKDAHIVASELLSALTKKSVTIPGTYENTYQEQCLSCVAEGQQGYLFPLEKAFIYVHKPTVHIRYDDIIEAEMHRASEFSAAQSFDLELEIKIGGGNTKIQRFTAIPKVEFKALKAFMEGKKVKVKAPKQASGQVGSAAAFGSDDDGEADPYMNMVGGGLAEDEDSEEDEDFKGGDASSSSGSDSEGTGSGSGSGSDEEAEKPEKKKKKKKEKRSRGSGDEGEEDVAKPVKKQKKKKDERQPKTAPSAYMLFSADERPKLMEEKKAEIDSGEFKPTDVMKALGERWKLADATTKQPYMDQNAEAKTKYIEEKRVYDAMIHEEKIASGWVPPVKGSKAPKEKKDKLEIDPNAPKKPQGSFFIYINKNREMIKETYPEVQKHTEISKKAGELWKEMDEVTKKEYTDEADAAKAQYEIDYAAYKESDAGKAFIAAAKVVEPKKRVASKKKGDSTSQSKLAFKSAETIEDSDDE
jgi:structure-specific recognition protein 1